MSDTDDEPCDETRTYEVMVSGVRPVSARAEITVPEGCSDPEDAIRRQVDEIAGDLDWRSDVGTVDLSIESCRRWS